MLQVTQAVTSSNCAFMLIDMQEKLLLAMHNFSCLVATVEKALKVFDILGLPQLITEQYPRGLGLTIPSIKNDLKEAPMEKTSFDALKNPDIQKSCLDFSSQVWIIMGIEAHICVLQTVRSLLQMGKTPIVLSDAVSSRKLKDTKSALQEMQKWGVRISSLETIVFEMLEDSKHGHFKAIQGLLK